MAALWDGVDIKPLIVIESTRFGRYFLTDQNQNGSLHSNLSRFFHRPFEVTADVPVFPVHGNGI